MNIREINCKDGILKVETNANDKQWNKLIKWIEENTDNTMFSTRQELKQFHGIALNVIM